MTFKKFMELIKNIILWAGVRILFFLWVLFWFIVAMYYIIIKPKIGG